MCTRSTGLRKTLVSDRRADCCIGSFNLRGWDLLLDRVEQLPGGWLGENSEYGGTYFCRVLIGMQKMPMAEREEYFSEHKTPIDNAAANAKKKEITADVRKQLTIGIPTNRDEATLKKLSLQLHSRKVVVKLHLAFPLHAKRYLAYRRIITPLLLVFWGAATSPLRDLQSRGNSMWSCRNRRSPKNWNRGFRTAGRTAGALT
jgi:hypothetical protein